MFEPLQSLILNPVSGRARSSVICLHGLGANGYDLEPLAKAWMSYDPTLRVILPHAPVQAVCANGGARMRAWYDLYSWSFLEQEDYAGIQASQDAINQLIRAEEAAGISSHQIALAGFSQGGALALYTGLHYPKSLAGIIGLSTYLACRQDFSVEKIQANHQTPIFMAHGRFDPIVPLALAQSSSVILESLGCKIEWHSYEMEHALIESEIIESASFLKGVFDH
jgi:phospholipase/carboxylesterase